MRAFDKRISKGALVIAYGQSRRPRVEATVVGQASPGTWICKYIANDLDARIGYEPGDEVTILTTEFDEHGERILHYLRHGERVAQRNTLLSIEISNAKDQPKRRKYKVTHLDLPRDSVELPDDEKEPWLIAAIETIRAKITDVGAPKDLGLWCKLVIKVADKVVEFEIDPVANGDLTETFETKRSLEEARTYVENRLMMRLGLARCPSAS